jgi:hypothetical protein
LLKGQEQKKDTLSIPNAKLLRYLQILTSKKLGMTGFLINKNLTMSLELSL